MDNLVVKITNDEYNKIKVEQDPPFTTFVKRDLDLINSFPINYILIKNNFIVSTGERKIEIEKNTDSYFLVKVGGNGNTYYKCDDVDGLKSFFSLLFNKPK